MEIPMRLLDTVEQLPPLPLTVRRLVALLANEDFLISELLGVVEEDPVLVARLIRAANSAAYGGTQDAQSTRAAVVRLGLHRVTEVSLVGSLFDLGTVADRVSQFQDSFWLHSQAAARASERLAAAMGPLAPGKLAGAAALLHDVGHLVIHHSGIVHPEDLRRAVENHDGDLLAAERELLGCDHTEVGGAVAEKWNLPAPIIRAIGNHHSVLDEDDALVDTVVLSDRVADVAGASLEALENAGGIPHVPDSILLRRGLSETEFAAICVEVEKMVGLLRSAHLIAV